MTERRPARTAGTVLAVAGRILVRVLSVALGTFGALGGGGKAIDPPPLPTPRSEKYRP